MQLFSKKTCFSLLWQCPPTLMPVLSSGKCFKLHRSGNESVDGGPPDQNPVMTMQSPGLNPTEISGMWWRGGLSVTNHQTKLTNLNSCPRSEIKWPKNNVKGWWRPRQNTWKLWLKIRLFMDKPLRRRTCINALPNPPPWLSYSQHGTVTLHCSLGHRMGLPLARLRHKCMISELFLS